MIREIPQSTSLQLSHADNTRHLPNISQGRMRTHTRSWSHRQTNKCGWGCVERVGADKMKRKERSFTLWGGPQTPLKSSQLLIPNQRKVSRSKGKRSPSSPSGQQEKGWMNLKQTSERLAASRTARQGNQLPRACWTDRRARVSDWYVVIKSFSTLQLQHHVCLVNNTSWVSIDAVHHNVCSYFYNCVCTHSKKALVSCMHSYNALCLSVCVCLYEWLTWLQKHSVRLLCKSCRCILFETGFLV